MGVKIKEKSVDWINEKIAVQDYPKAVIEWYYKKTGQKLNLQHPHTFNEKIQWLKLNDSSEIKTRLTDKYEVRKWVEEKIGRKYLVELLEVWDSVENINWDLLPEKFILKATHGSGWNILIKNKSQMNKQDVEKMLNKWMNMRWWNLAGLELHYKNITPRIITEEYLENAKGELSDYKVFCFNGKARYIMFITGRFSEIKSAFYDLNWKKQEFTFTYPLYEGEIEKPENLEELVYVAEKLAEGFYHVRVDFYVLDDNQIKFGEMTFTTSSGVAKWMPKKYDEILGDMLRLPIDESRLR